MKKSFELELVVKDCTTQFKEGFSVGGFAKQTISFNVTDNEAAKPMFKAALLDHMEQFLRENVEVRIKEVPSEVPAK